MTDGKDRNIIVARVTDAFGIEGQIKVRLFTEEPENLLGIKNWILSAPGRKTLSVEVVAVRLRQDIAIAALKGLTTRDEALELKGSDILIPFSSLPELPPGEYYWNELIGLTVHNIDGMEFGTVTEIIETGANDVLVINGKRTCLIPYLDNVILEIDLVQERMLVDWLEDF